MSSNHLNLYVTKNAKGLNSFETICSTMFGAKKTKLNQKAQLTQLRELSIYLSAVTSIDENVFSAITSFLKDLGDSDTDRKLFRTAMYLLIEAITEYSARNELTNKRGAVLVLNNLLGKELSQKGGSSKQLLIWRNVGAIVWAHNSQFRRLSALEVEGKPSLLSRNTDIETTIVSRVHSTFEGLSFPVKQKKSVLFGDDKEFLPKMLQWTSVLSAVVRSEEALPKKAWENLSYGLTCTSYTPLAQHAFRALLNTAKQTQDPTMQLQLINQLLADRDGSKGREYLNTSDVLCCTYYIRTLTALAENNPDLAKVDPTVKHTECSPVLKALVGLYVGALRFLQSNSVKTVTDMANALLDRQLGPRIICLIDQHLRGQRRPVNTRTVPGKSNNNNAKVGVIAMVTEALQNHLQAQRSIESIELPPLLRACETLGRFLVHRPYISAKQQQKDGDTIAGLWTTLRRHYRSCLMPKDDCVGTDAQRAGRALAQRQLRAQAGSSCGGSNCVGYTGKSSWSWPSDNPSIATSAVNHDPHVLCALLRAQIWMAPDKRYCPKEHGLLWGAFAESLLSSWQLMTTTLSRDFDLLSLLLPLLHELFARVQASMLVPLHPHGGNSAAPTPISSYTHFLELGEVGTGPAAIPEVGIHYQPVYVDVLVALSEQLVMVTRSGIAVSFLQSVWKWLQAFTTAKQHKQQAALQLKKELRSQQLASAGIGANNTSLLFPSNLTTMAPLATAQVETPVESVVEAHEAHADQVLLQSVARMTVYAQQQQHLLTASVPQVVGTFAVEAAHVMQNMYTSGLWHLVDNAMLCFALPPAATSEGGDIATAESAAAAHVSSLLLVVKILSEAAIQGQQPNVRNSAILSLAKLSSQMLLLSEKGELGLEKDGASVVLGAVFKDLALVYLTHYGHTLDVTYRHVLQQLLGSASTSLRQRAGQAQAAGGVDLVVELMAHIFAQPGASSSVTSALPTVFTILRDTMKMLCAALQTTGSALEEGGFRAFAVAHAQLSRNTFVLLVPPALPEEPEEEEEEDFDEYEEPEESTSVPAGDAAPSLVASTPGGQFNGFDDDFFGGGWSSSATVLQPTIAVKPLAVAASAPSVNLLDTEDMWIFDTPVVPEKSPKPFSSASLKAGALLDFFGQSSQPLVPASSKHQTPAGGDADPVPVLVPVIAEPPRKPIILFRDIYGEDEPFTASNNTDSAADVAFAPSVADAGSSTAFHATPDFATTPAFPVTSTSGTSATGDLDWPTGGSAHTGDGFDLSASATNAFDGWGGASTAASFPAAATMDDGFAPTTHPFASTTASTVAPRSSFTSPPAVQAVSDNWSMPNDGFAPSAAAPSVVAPTAATQFADDGFGNLPGFAPEPAVGAAPPSNTVRRASFSNSKAALSAEEVAAQAAAKRANRRASMGASATQGKLAADPFFSAAPLVPLTAATSTTAAAPVKVAAADCWPGASAADGFATLPSTTTAAWGTSGNDGFASHDAFASTPAGFGTSAPAAVVDDGFSATPADFVPTPAAGPAAAGYYGQQYEGYPPYPPAAGAYPPTAYPPSAYPPAAYPQAAYDSGGYAYPPAPAGQYDYNYGNYPAQGYAAPPAGYGQPPADGHHHAPHYGTQQAAPGYGAGYADPNAYQGAYGYAQPPQQAGAGPAAHGYYPHPAAPAGAAAGAQAGYPGQQQQAYPPYAYPPQGGYPPAPGHS